MPEYLAPGVYVEEKDSGAKAIEGVSTTTSGMVGVTERGPEGVPTLVIGFADFRRQFGGLLDRHLYTGANWYLPFAVDGFFTNGGKRLYVTRVLPKEATRAEVTLFDRETAGGVETELAAPARVGDEAIFVANKTGIAAGEWLGVVDGASTEYVHVLDVATAAALTRRNGSHLAHAIGDTIEQVSATPTAIGTAAAVAAGDSQVMVSGTAAVTVAADDVLKVGDEYVIVKTATNVATTPTAVPLHYPFASPHAAAVAVSTVGIVSTTTSAKLLTSIAAGDRLFAATAGFGATAVVVKFKGTVPEYDEVLPVSAARMNKGARFAHPAGTEVATVAVSVTGGTALAIAASAAAGSTTIVLGSTTGLTAGMVLVIGPATPGPTTEFIELDSIDSTSSTATLREPLAFAHGTADKVVFGATLTATAAGALSAPLAAGQKLLLTSPAIANTATVLKLGTTTNAEYRMIAGFPTISAIATGNPASGSDPDKRVPLAGDHSAERVVLGREEQLFVEAIDRGTWGNGLYVTVEDDDPLLDTTATEVRPPTATDIALRTTVGIESGTVLEVGYTDTAAGTLLLVTSVSASNGKAGFAAPIGIAVAVGDKVRTREFRVTVQLRQLNPTTNKLRTIEGEVHRRLSMNSLHSRYFAKVIGRLFVDDLTTPLQADGRTQGESDLIRVEDVLSEAAAATTLRLGPDLLTDTLPDERIVPVPSRLSGGDDSIATITEDTYIGVDDLDPHKRLGLHALKNIEEISIVAIPGRTEQKVQQALLDHCELMRYRFAVLDAGPGENIAEVKEHRSLYDSKYGALYHPWLTIDDPFPDNPRVVGQIAIPPSGHVIGIYARSDIERGVHKAPANEVVRGITGLVTKLAKEHQDILNPLNINVIRNFRESNRGLRVWGARTLTSDADWKYINVRRLFLFLEHSIDRGTQWAVFEPNSELLWQRVRRVISSFLTAVWRDGALMGLKPEEAYFVKCDRTTMSQSDIDNGRLIVEIGVAPVKPAEFVVFRIGQWAGGSDLDEG